MFSNNRKISTRQVERLFIIDLLGISSLLLPRFLARVAGNAGIFSILAGGGLALVLVWILSWKLKGIQGSYYTWLRSKIGVFFAGALMVLYLIFFLFLSAFALFQATAMIKATLWPQGGLIWIYLLLLVLVAYAATQDIEGRARIYEILFWILGIPLLFMLVLAARDVRINYFHPMLVRGWGAFFKGTALVFLFFLPTLMILFLKPFTRRPQELGRAGVKAVLITTGVNLVIYAILIGTYQSSAMAALDYPILTLMSTVRLPGGFFARLDTFMTGIWFFALFALINSGVFYTCHILKELFGGKIRKITLPVILVLVFLGATLLFAGCSATELEERAFPLAIAIDKSGEGISLSFDFPEASKESGGKGVQGEEEAGGSEKGLAVEAESFNHALRIYENNSNRTLDFNHLKAIILSEDFFADGDLLVHFLAALEEEEVLARNTVAFIARDSAAEILTLKEGFDGSVGDFLEQMIQNREDIKKRDIVTIGSLMKERHNQNERLLIPVLAYNGGYPSIVDFAVVENFRR